MSTDPAGVWLVGAGLVVALILLAVVAIRLRVSLSRLEREVAIRATQQYDQWRERDLGVAESEMKRIAGEEARLALEQWKHQHELSIRQDAISRSQATVIGKVAEHMAPYLPDFPYNPRDARFLGSPIDFVVFDGADEGKVREIVFIEVKTGNSALTTKQRLIRDAILDARISWLEWRI